ncbi:MAG TPA: hypothetical protein VGX70_05310 [Gemmataceae bacterium]|jgi:hypothetical protein|nr:hypothetical protein [Gemmataceae bacterium]
MKPNHILWGCLLLLGCLQAGCGKHSTGISPESEANAAESSEAVTSDQGAAVPSKSASEFPFPADKGGQLLADRLRPANQIPPLPEEKATASKRLAGSAKLENPEVPLPKILTLHLPSLPLTKTKQIRPTLVEGEPPLSRERLDLPGPGPVKLAAGPKVAWPSPDINQPMPLPILARLVTDRASLDDPSGDASQAAALAAKVPDRTTPAPFLKLTIPDPFEHRNTVRLRAAPAITFPIEGLPSPRP